jgi:hypothetical protein
MRLFSWAFRHDGFWCGGTCGGFVEKKEARRKEGDRRMMQEETAMSIVGGMSLQEEQREERGETGWDEERWGMLGD